MVEKTDLILAAVLIGGGVLAYREVEDVGEEFAAGIGGGITGIFDSITDALGGDDSGLVKEPTPTGEAGLFDAGLADAGGLFSGIIDAYTGERFVKQREARGAAPAPELFGFTKLVETGPLGLVSAGVEEVGGFINPMTPELEAQRKALVSGEQLADPESLYYKVTTGRKKRKAAILTAAREQTAAPTPTAAAPTKAGIIRKKKEEERRTIRGPAIFSAIRGR